MAVPDRSGDIRQYGRSANRTGDPPIAFIFLRVCPRRSLLRPPALLRVEHADTGTRRPDNTKGAHPCLLPTTPREMRGEGPDAPLL